uniref:Borealin N-terminal domain-containing protein n=1 Tax=Oncorhynchus mykiss TaxID=8022 RepID=A0A8L0DW46_ONCMY
MALRRIRKISNQTEGYADGQISKETRQKQGTLFIQQFEKEAQERINEMEEKIEQTLATVDWVFKVELMKMPPALQKTVIDLINADGITAGEVTIAIKVGLNIDYQTGCKWLPPCGIRQKCQNITGFFLQTESPEIHQPLTRKVSKGSGLFPPLT